MEVSITFRDRSHAGRELGARLAGRELVDPVVVALPRGGVPVGFEVAAILDAPLDVMVVRKVGAPRQPEFGIGAVSEGGASVADDATLRSLGVTAEAFESLTDVELAEVRRRVERYRGGRPLTAFKGRDVVLVDDGLATGVTAEVAVLDLQARGPRSITLAVPVCSREARARLAELVDEIICVEEPPRFRAVGLWYDRFDQTSDEEVISLLERARPKPASQQRARPTSVALSVAVAGGAVVRGDVVVPHDPIGVVVFAHGSGRARHSPLNRSVAGRFNERGLATVLLDLLTVEEASAEVTGGRVRFDVNLLAGRLEAAIDEVGRDPETSGLRIGCFGASTGAAAALLTAGRRPDVVHAVVSRGGRPDLAGAVLEDVRAPTLLIVGGADTEVLALNEAAGARLAGPWHLEVVPGATHHFEQPGALDQVAVLAARWFTTHLGHEEIAR